MPLFYLINIKLYHIQRSVGGARDGSPKSQEMVSLSNTMTLSPPIFIKNLGEHEQFNVSDFGNYIKMTF